MEIDFDKMDGLVPAVVQDAGTGEVLMVAFMNADAWRETRESGYATFFSRRRQALWRKGETSGHRLRVVEARIDCDADALLLKVQPAGPGVCHEGYRSCFFRAAAGSEWSICETLAFQPDEVYA
jgi:phosphoribosyl-AMP cyclohydrolase